MFIVGIQGNVSCDIFLVHCKHLVNICPSYETYSHQGKPISLRSCVCVCVCVCVRVRTHACAVGGCQGRREKVSTE